MLSGVSVICFAASYAIALVLEVSRLLFRSGVRGAIMLGFAGAGLLAHTIYLFHRAVSTAGAPLSSERDWYLVAAWLLVAVYLYLVWFHPRTAFGLFLLPLALGLIAAGALLADAEPFAREPASKAWGVVHGTSLGLGAVAISFGFAAGLMYLVQVRRLKRKVPPGRGPRLPSLEWLEHVNLRATVIAVAMLSLGVLSGMVLNAIRAERRLPLHDPLVFCTLLMLAWLVAAAIAGRWLKTHAAGRRVAYLTIVSFVFLLLALAAMLLMSTEHGGKGGQVGFQISDFRFQIADYGFQISDFRFQIADYGLQISEGRTDFNGRSISTALGKRPTGAGRLCRQFRSLISNTSNLKSAICNLKSEICNLQSEISPSCGAPA